jgi:hypothetical protein
LREDFALWRSQSRNRMTIAGIMIAIGVAGLAFVLRKLWQSKRTTGPASTRRKVADAAISTPLHRLEKPASKRLPPRQPGDPFCHWLAGLRDDLTDPSLLDEAIRLHQRLRFDPAPTQPSATARLTDLTKTLKLALKKRPKPKRLP